MEVEGEDGPKGNVKKDGPAEEGEEKRDGEVDIVWKVSTTTTWVPVPEEAVLKMETMEVIVHSVNVPKALRERVGDTGLPAPVDRVLQVSPSLIKVLDRVRGVRWESGD